MIVRLELTSSEKLILCSGDTAATYRLSDISLEYDAIFDEPYTTTTDELYAGTMVIPYSKLTLINYQKVSKKDTIWENNLSVRPLQGLLLLFLDKRNDFANKNETLDHLSFKKTLAAINRMPHKLFEASLQARDIYPELRRYFYKEHSNVTWEEFLTTKIGLWINTRSSVDNTLHGSVRAVEKSGILLQIEKAAESNDSDLTYHLFSSEDVVTHLTVSHPSRILTIKK